MTHHVKDQQRGGKREPLECIPVMHVDPQIRSTPLAFKPVLYIVFLLDDHRLNRNSHRSPITIEREILPNIAISDFAR